MYILNKIIKYPKKTLEQSLKEVMKSKNKMISGKYSPTIFSMNYEEVKYKSIDGLNLYGWYIKRSDEPKNTILLLHGRNNNRIFCLKFLQIFSEIDKENKYNIFIPDLRNSGKSDEAITAFGYFFARDIYSSMKMLNERYKLNNFVLYGFSQGGMGAAICSKLFQKELSEKNIKISKMILDSPVSNIQKIILHHSKIKDYTIPKVFLIPSFIALNKIVDKNLKKLRLSELLGDIPTLLLQSKKDKLTPFRIIEKEYFNLDDEKKEKVRFKAFRKGQHVRIYLEYKEEYTQTINKFLESEKI